MKQFPVKIEIHDDLNNPVATVDAFDECTASVKFFDDFLTNASEWTNVSLEIHKALVSMKLEGDECLKS